MCFSTVGATGNMMNAVPGYGQAAGGALGSIFNFWCSLFLGLCSVAVGSIGWLFIMKKKLYKCIKCSYIPERG